jgi:anti-sigma-K factor RskA
MTCDELRPDYLLYTLGVLEEPERSEIRVHLERGCEPCTAGLGEARALAFAMGAAQEGPEPPRRLRGRILAAAGGTPERRWNWFTAWLATGATALAAAGLLVYQAHNFQAQLDEARVEIARSGAEAGTLRQALDLIEAPETREVTFGQGTPEPPRGRVFFHPSGVLLVASRLPAPPPGKTYEMWIIREGKPAPAGLFQSNQQGNAIHLYRPPSPPATSDVIAVTLEAAGGVGAPTAKPVIVAPL